MPITDLEITEQDIAGKRVQDLEDTPSSLTPAQLKKRFDELVEGVIIPRYNSLIREIKPMLPYSSGDSEGNIVVIGPDGGATDSYVNINDLTYLARPSGSGNYALQGPNTNTEVTIAKIDLGSSSSSTATVIVDGWGRPNGASADKATLMPSSCAFQLKAFLRKGESITAGSCRFECTSSSGRYFTPESFSLRQELDSSNNPTGTFFITWRQCGNPSDGTGVAGKNATSMDLRVQVLVEGDGSASALPNGTTAHYNILYCRPRNVGFNLNGKPTAGATSFTLHYNGIHPDTNLICQIGSNASAVTGVTVTYTSASDVAPNAFQANACAITVYFASALSSIPSSGFNFRFFAF